MDLYPLLVEIFLFRAVSYQPLAISRQLTALLLRQSPCVVTWNNEPHGLQTLASVLTNPEGIERL